MTDQVDSKHFMHKAVADLAQARADQAAAALALDALSNEIAQHVEEIYGERLKAAKDKANAANIAASRSDKAVRDMAVQFYNKTQDKHPHLAVSVREYTVLGYNADDAFTYCVKHLPTALKMDKRRFAKVAKVAELDFVTITKEPRAVVSQDLSAWLEVEKTDEN